MARSRTPEAAPASPDDARSPTPAASPSIEPLAQLRSLSSLHEAERHAVAAALHNRVGQAVSAIKMSAHLSLDETDPAQRREDLLEIVRIADETVAQLRDLYAQLRPPQLDALGLEAALRGELDRVQLPLAVQVRLDLAALPRRADPEIEIACVRIAQQCLRAAASAADARALALSLRAQGDGLSLSIRLETGAGEADEPGIDLALMHGRASSLGGSLSFERGLRGSFDALLHLPWSPPADADRAARGDRSGSDRA